MKQSHEEWLEERRKSIGGSDAAALVGMNFFKTPYMLWADKSGRMPPKEDNEAMRQGRDLEAYVAHRFCEASGKKVHVCSQMLRNPKYPFAHANIDRKITGERAGLECKTTSIMNLKKFKHGEYPANYYAQCMHYLAVTGWDRWYLAVLILNQGFYWYTIERDEDEIQALMDAEKDFWENYVLPDVAPAVDGLVPTDEAIKTVFPSSNSGASVDLFGRESLINEYLATKNLIKTYEQENQKIKQILQLDLADAELGLCGNYKVIWKEQTRNTFDLQKFMTDHPEIDYSPYYSTSSFRKFDIKEQKQDGKLNTEKC